jgi:histidinol-phosphatase (PHP family)
MPRYTIDYQVHSLRSHDGTATIHQMCREAVRRGLHEIGFSEHKDFDPADPVVNHFDYHRFAREIDKAREAFAGSLRIRMGVEIDYQRWFEDVIARYLDEHPFDYVIGSVHYVDRQMLMTPEYLASRTPHKAWSDYFNAVRHSVESGLIDIVGHLEYANRRAVTALGPWDPSPYEGHAARLFRAMIRHGTALEINSAGLRQGVGHTYPCEHHIRMYRRLGGTRITFGSDAHTPDDLAHRFEEVYNLAHRCGFVEQTLYSQRTPVQQPLFIP